MRKRAIDIKREQYTYLTMYLGRERRNQRVRVKREIGMKRHRKCETVIEREREKK